MSPRTKPILLALLAVVVVGGGLWASLSPSALLHKKGESAAPSLKEQIDAAKAANAPGLSAEATARANALADGDLGKKYQNDAIGFAFLYPAGLEAGATNDELSGATTVVVQDAEAHVGFQIVISPWDDADTTITAERIAADVPEIKMREPNEVTVAGAQGLAFRAEDPSFGDSRQVWFIYDGHLYQVSGYSSQDALLSKVLGTWAFKQ